MVDLAGLGSEALLQALQEAATRLSIGFAVLDIAEPQRILYVSDSACAIFGRTRAELEGSSPWMVIAPEALATERERFANRGRGAAPPETFDSTILRPDGTRVPVELSITRAITPKGAINVTFVRDITARIAAVETLRRSEERFRHVVEGAPDGVVILQRGQIAFMNELGATLLGLPSAAAGIGTRIGELLVHEDAVIAAERIRQMMATGVTLEPAEYRPKADPERIVEIKSIMIDREGEPAVLAFARDVSARKRLERELVRSDRLASLGMLSAAVAHEINNPLAYVQLSLQYLERELPNVVDPARRDQILEHLRNASHGTDRVATIVRDLRVFARPDDGEIGRVDVAACIQRACKMVDNEVRHRATLVRDFHDVPAVRGNASKLEQVFLNVLINAAQALPVDDSTAHEIKIAVRQQGERVTIAISDTGTGIAPEVRSRVFEPFFTTKDVGVGTGLGLAICRSIIEEIGGRIELGSAEPRGTVVTVTLPVHHGDGPAIQIPPKGAGSARRRVLVVDDEPLIRRALANVLDRHHDVIVAEHARQAIEVIKSNNVDVVLCDMMMPMMNGKDLYDYVVENHPALAKRFIFITGGALGSHLADFLEKMPVLHKPFELAQVLELVAVTAER